MRNTARAIIIKDKAMLLVTGHDADFYWSPGGKIEVGENPSDALLRELKEELSITKATAKHYLSYEINYQNVTNYIVDTSDKPTPSSEITGLIYFSKKNYINKDVNISQGLKEKLIPALIKDGLL